MKFRLKGKNFPKQVLVEFDSSSVSVQDLKRRVSEILSLAEEERQSLKLSLNGKEVLNADDDESLASLGFVSGDAIYIICASSSKFENKVQEVGRQPSSSHQNVDMKSTSEERHTQDSCQPVQPPTPSASQDVMLSSGLQIWETPPNQVPSSYSLLVDSNPGKLQSPIEQLGGLLHLLMVEVGFHPETSKVLQPGCSPLPDSWALRSGTLKLQYKSMLPPNPSCTLVITEIGPVVMVHGTVAALDVKTVSLKLKIGDYVSPIGRNLAQLSRTFKDDIAFPLLCSMQRETKGVCLPNLSNLPLEILNKILLLLDAQTICRLAATCRFFQYLANQPELWKRLTIRKFGQEFAKKTTAESDWKKVYKEEHEKELRERRYVERQRRLLGDPDSWIPEIFPPSRGGVPPGFFPGVPDGPELPDYPFASGIMGGYGDLRPDLRGLEPPRRRTPFDRRMPGLPRPRYQGFPPW